MKKQTLVAVSILMASAAVASATEVKENYDKHCAKCHGADGKGDTKMGKKTGAKDYSNPKVQSEMKDENAFKAIKAGLKDKDDRVLMKPTEGLSDGEIRALVAHMRTFKK